MHPKLRWPRAQSAKNNGTQNSGNLEAAIDTLDFQYALQLCQTLIQFTQLNEITKTTEEL